MATCVYILKNDKACGAECLGISNVCKKHTLQLLLEDERKVPAQKAEAKKSKKKEKGPSKTNSFLLFIEENREDVKGAHPDLPVTEITKKLSEMWNAFKEENPEEAVKYQERAKQANEDAKRAFEAAKEESD